jgi:hypothetical protein
MAYQFLQKALYGFSNSKAFSSRPERASPKIKEPPMAYQFLQKAQYGFSNSNALAQGQKGQARRSKSLQWPINFSRKLCTVFQTATHSAQGQNGPARRAKRLGHGWPSRSAGMRVVFAIGLARSGLAPNQQRLSTQLNSQLPTPKIPHTPQKRGKLE